MCTQHRLIWTKYLITHTTGNLTRWLYKKMDDMSFCSVRYNPLSYLRSDHSRIKSSEYTSSPHDQPKKKPSLRIKSMWVVLWVFSLAHVLSDIIEREGIMTYTAAHLHLRFTFWEALMSSVFRYSQQVNYPVLWFILYFVQVVNWELKRNDE